MLDQIIFYGNSILTMIGYLFAIHLFYKKQYKEKGPTTWDLFILIMLIA
jgi:hypothetical protein